MAARSTVTSTCQSGSGGAYGDQYDQAGAMVRVDEEHWLKTGIEFVDGRIRFSTEQTLAYSSWAVADLPPGVSELSLHLARSERRGRGPLQRRRRAELSWPLSADLPPGKPSPGQCARRRTALASRSQFHDLVITPR